MNPLQMFSSPLSLYMPSAVSPLTAQANKYQQIIRAQMRQNMFPPSYATASSSYMPFQPALASATGWGGLANANKPQIYVAPPDENFYKPPKEEERTVPVNIKESLKGFMSEKLDREDVVKLGLLALVLWWLLRSPRFNGARGEVGGWLKERIGSLLDGGKKEEVKP